MDQTTYQITDNADSRRLTDSLCRERQCVPLVVELITGVEIAIDELIEVPGRTPVETVLTLSAQEVAGPQAS